MSNTLPYLPGCRKNLTGTDLKIGGGEKKDGFLKKSLKSKKRISGMGIGKKVIFQNEVFNFMAFCFV